MPEGSTTTRPRKKITFRRFAAFWLHVVWESLKKSIEPFERVGSAAAIIAGGAAIGFLFHLASQERADYMIYWTIAVPTIVWFIWLIWSLLSIPYEIYERDLTQVRAGAEITIKKTKYPLVIPIGIIVLVIMAFLELWIVKNQQISEVKNQVSKLPIPKKEIASRPPLPDKIIPQPQPIPIPVAPLAAVAAQEQPAPSSYTQDQLESFNSDDGTTNSDQTWANHVEELVKHEKEMVLAKQKADAEQKAADALAVINFQEHWYTNYLPNYRYTLIALHDILENEAQKSGDGIYESDKYFQCLPDTLAPNVGEFKPAEIKFQRHTNLDFIVSVSAPNVSGLRLLIISCESGRLETDGEYGVQYRCHFITDNPVAIDENRYTNIDNAHALIKQSIKDLVANEYYYLVSKNKR